MHCVIYLFRKCRDLFVLNKKKIRECQRAKMKGNFQRGKSVCCVRMYVSIFKTFPFAHSSNHFFLLHVLLLWGVKETFAAIAETADSLPALNASSIR